MVGYNFGPPALDFAPLGRLGETYDRSVKRTHEADIAAKREQALAGFGQNGDLAALGQTLLRAGDLEGGLQALRLSEAGQGTPWQRQRAAAEDARAAEADAYRRRQEEKADERYREGLTRADRPERFTQEGTDPDTGMPTLREGWKYPDGTVKWSDGKTSAPPLGPQSGGPGDPNLPAPDSVQAQTQIGAPLPNSTAERGYVIPGSLEGFPHGTTRMPGDPNARGPGGVPVQATLPAPAGSTAVAASPSAPLAPPAIAGPVAVAAPPQAQPAPQRRATRADPLEPETVPFVRWPPLNVNAKEWVTAETKRLAALASGGTDAAKSLGESAGKLAVAEQYLANAPQIRDKIAKGEQTGLWDRTMAVNNLGEQGHVQSMISSGVDALVHMMTGAGMNESEARRKIGRYEPALLDTPERLLAKHDALVSELKQWRELAYRGKGAAGELPKPAAPYGSDFKPLEIGGKREVGGGILERVK